VAEQGNVDGQQMRQRLAKLANQWSKGRVTLKQIVGLNDAELFAVANQGYYMFLQGKSEEARVVFEGLVAVDPKNAYYYRALGAIYWRLREPQKAVKQFTYAMRVAPNDVSSYVNRAEVYVAMRNYSSARDDLRFALENAVAAEQALVNKARAILRMIP